MNERRDGAGPDGEGPTLGKKLRESREYIGLTLNEVAMCLGISPRVMSEIESDRIGCGETEMKKLARLYRRPVDFFTGQVKVNAGEHGVFGGIEILSDRDRSELQRFAEFLQHEPEGAVTKWPFRSGKDCAVRLHRVLGLESCENPVQRIPVFDCIDRIGAKLMFRMLEKLHGSFIKQGDAAGIILDTKEPLCVQRYTAAYQLGRMLLGHETPAYNHAPLPWNVIADGLRPITEEDTKEEKIRKILIYLNASYVRCTYSAVGDVVKVPARSVGGLLGEKCRKKSWVVNSTGDPTGYDANQKHPRLKEKKDIIRSGNELESRLREWTGSVEADAFASYFLLPRCLIDAHMVAQGWDRRSFEWSQVVYQASLRLGTSYEAMIQALEREKIIEPDVRCRLLEMRIPDLKLGILGDWGAPNAPCGDVWRLTEKDDGLVVEVRRGDLLLLRLPEETGSGYAWTFDDLRKVGFAILKYEREKVPDEQAGERTIRRVLARAAGPWDGEVRLELCRPYGLDDKPRFMTLRCRTATSDEPGLLEAQRRNMLADS